MGIPMSTEYFLPYSSLMSSMFPQKLSKSNIAGSAGMAMFAWTGNPETPHSVCYAPQVHCIGEVQET